MPPAACLRPSQEGFAQNQLKQLKRGLQASCRTCLPTPAAEVKAAQDAAVLAAFNARVTGGAMDGVTRTVNGGKRKAHAPSQHMKEQIIATTLIFFAPQGRTNAPMAKKGR